MTDRAAIRRLLVCVLAGFSSGLPLYVLITLVPAWLREEGVDLTTLGLLSLVGLPYTWKFLWAPVLDRYSLGPLGRRRGWALLLQLGLALAIGALGSLVGPAQLGAVVALCVAVAFLSATQDIVLDAWRRELLPDAELGLGTGLFVNAYRAAQLVPGSLALVLADHQPWSTVFPVVACFLAVGALGSVLAPDPEVEAPPRSLSEAVWLPLQELWGRGRALIPLAGVLVLYKLGDALSTALITPFWLDVGFDKTTIGAVARPVGLGFTVLGGLVGGLWMTRLGIDRALWIFGAVQALGTFGYALLALAGPDVRVLAAAVAVDDLGQGLGATALVAWAQRNTDRRFSATQYALFSSIVALPRTVLGSATGWMVEAVGWPWFFVGCTLLALPGFVVLSWVAPWTRTPVQA